MPTMTSDKNSSALPRDAMLIDRWLDDWLQRNLAVTLVAYRRDLHELGRWLGGTAFCRGCAADLLAYVAHRYERGYRPRSTARQCPGRVASIVGC